MSVEDSTIRVRTLSAIAESTPDWPAVTRKQDLRLGDRVVVTTKNSVYWLDSLGGDLFYVSGGWFERAAAAAERLVTVNGCTFGGTVICTDIVAAPGLFLEFGNLVSTTRIRDVRVVRGPWAPGVGADALPN